MRILSFIVGAFFLSNVLVVPSRAEGVQPRYGIIDWFPFGWIENGESKGMMVEMAHAIDRAIGTKSEIVVAPVPRVLRGISENTYDFTITYRDADMLPDVEYLADIGCLRSAIVSMKTAPVMSLEGLNGKRVAFPGGGYFVKRFLPSLNLDGVEVAQTFIMYKMALRGRLDAFIINDAVWFGYKADLYPDYKVPHARWKDFAEPQYLETLPVAVSMGNGSTHSQTAAAIKALMGNPRFVSSLQAIYKKYALPNALQCLPEFSAGTTE